MSTELRWKRIEAGEYESEDGRFTISSTWNRLYGDHWKLCDNREAEPYYGVAHKSSLKQCKHCAELILAREKAIAEHTLSFIKDGMKLEKHYEQDSIFHITTQDRVEDIKKSGLIPSAYGDMDVDDNDGRGVYAVLAYMANDELLQELKAGQTQPLAAIKFRTAGPWYLCVQDLAVDGEHVNRTGCILHPEPVPADNILGILNI